MTACDYCHQRFYSPRDATEVMPGVHYCSWCAKHPRTYRDKHGRTRFIRIRLIDGEYWLERCYDGMRTPCGSDWSDARVEQAKEIRANAVYRVGDSVFEHGAQAPGRVERVGRYGVSVFRDGRIGGLRDVSDVSLFVPCDRCGSDDSLIYKRNEYDELICEVCHDNEGEPTQAQIEGAAEACASPRLSREDYL